MIRSKFFGLMAILLLLLNGCRVTRFEVYEFGGSLALENKDVRLEDSEAFAFVYINNSFKKGKNITLFRDSYVRKGGYLYRFRMCVGFGKIEELEAFFIQNGERKINIPISIEDFNKRKEESKGGFCYSYGSYKEPIPLPIVWEETGTLSVEVNFVATENGKKKKYKLREDYKKDFTVEDTNLTWDAVMGI